jgi:hypothetical protein
MVELPWTKREVIDTVIAEYRPGSAEPFVFVMVRMFSRLALGRPEGRAAPYLEHALCARIERVVQALCDGRDPDVAYELPLDEEAPLTPDDQLSPAYREFAKILDESDRKLRAARRGKRG